MKATILTSSLSAALSVAGRSVGTDRTSPTAGHVLLEATPDDGIVLAGDDRRIRSWTTAEADVQEPGAICLKKDALDAFLGALEPLGDVSLTVDAKGRATLACGATMVRMAGIAAENFPAAPSTDDIQADIVLTAPQLAALVSATAFAADSKPDSNPTRECVHVAAYGDAIRFEATDGLRLARRTMALDVATDADLMVPASALVRAVSIVGTGNLERLAVTPSHLLLDAEGGHVAILRTEGQFPDSDRIVPKEHTSRVLVDRATLKRALGLVRNLEKVAVGYRVDLDITAESMTLSAADRSTDHEARTEIRVDLIGDPLALGVTATHLAQALDSLDAYERVVLLFQGDARPLMVCGIDDEAQSQVHILMPLITARPK